MKIQPYVEKLNSSEKFKDFQEKHKDAFLVAGFFVLDFESNQHLHQIDYYIPSEKKVAAFTLDDEVILQLMNTMNEKIPEKLDIKTNIDLDAIKGILEDEMKNRSITEEIKKIIAVIQTIEGKKVWLISCILSGMEILKAHIDDETRTVLKMETASVLDYVKKIPMQPGAEGAEKPSKENIDKQLEQLEKLKQALEKEKDKIEKEKHEALEKEKDNSAEKN